MLTRVEHETILYHKSLPFWFLSGIPWDYITTYNEFNVALRQISCFIWAGSWEMYFWNVFDNLTIILWCKQDISCYIGFELYAIFEMWWYKSLKLYLISTSVNFISHEFKSWNRILSDPRRVTFNSTTITIRLRLCSQTPKSSFVYTNIICEVRMSHFAVKPFDMKSAVTHNTPLIFITCKIKYFHPFIYLSTKIIRVYFFQIIILK